MAERVIAVEVVYAQAGVQFHRCVDVPEGSTIMDAIEASGVAEVLPRGVIDPDRLGVFSNRVSSEQELTAGDRVEIYRPLTLDPMEARRRRAESKSRK